MIPDEAVEAAWWAMPKESYVDSREHVRAMLEAAAPHLQSAAWQRGVQDGYHHRPNPYKEQA